MNHCNWDMQDSIDNPILIIHSKEHSKDRTENVNKLYSLNPDNATIIDAKFDLDEDEKTALSNTLTEVKKTVSETGL